MIDDAMKEHYLKTATNYFLVLQFLGHPESQKLGSLARSALLLMIEPGPYVTAKQFAGRMAVSEAEAKAALEELLAAGHVYGKRYVNDCWYRFMTDRIDFENQSDEDAAARKSIEFQKSRPEW